MRAYYFLFFTLYVIASYVIAITVTIICAKIRRGALTTITIGMWIYVLGLTIYLSRSMIRMVDYSFYREIRSIIKPFSMFASSFRAIGMIIVAVGIIWLYKTYIETKIEN